MLSCTFKLIAAVSFRYIVLTCSCKQALCREDLRLQTGALQRGFAAANNLVLWSKEKQELQLLRLTCSSDQQRETDLFITLNFAFIIFRAAC